MFMKQPITIIGIGEMAGVFARGFLRIGHPVYPVTRDTNMAELAKKITPPALALVAVGENDLHETLEIIPPQWRDNIGLLQNELLPRDWEIHSLTNPTVISVWFEKKKGQDYKVLIPSPAFGPQAKLLCSALHSIGIPCRELDNQDELLYELVRKNVYILTTNIAGLETGGTVETLWNEHQDLARQVANEVMDIQDCLTGVKHPRERLIAGMEEAINGDLNHKCMGRSAPARLARAIGFVDQAGLKVPKLREIHSHLNQP
jgi:hypothetical protein